MPPPHPPSTPPSAPPPAATATVTATGSGTTPPPKKRRFSRETTLEDAGLTDSEFAHYFPTLIRTPSMAWMTFGELSTMDNQNHNRQQQQTNKSLLVNDRFSANNRKAKEHRDIDPGVDNRYDILHEIRYDKGPIIDSAKVFAMANSRIKAEEILPTNNYEFYSMGNVYATEQGIELVHHPGSPDLRVKMFSVENASKPRSQSQGFTFVHDVGGNPVAIPANYFSDVTEVGKFHISFFHLFIWKSRAVPWDHSLEVVWKFYIIHKWFDCEIVVACYRRVVSQGKFLAEFTDWILVVNAGRYSDGLPHLNFSDLTEQLGTFCENTDICEFIGNSYAADLSKCENALVDLKGAMAGTSGGSGGNSGNGGSSGSGSNQSKKNKPKKKQENAPWSPNPPGTFFDVHRICSKYNGDGCPNKASGFTNKCFDPQSKRRFLHICSHQMINPTVRDGGPCGQKHPAFEHDRHV